VAVVEFTIIEVLEVEGICAAIVVTHPVW
jgi:hypothetical protein